MPGLGQAAITLSWSSIRMTFDLFTDQRHRATFCWLLEQRHGKVRRRQISCIREAFALHLDHSAKGFPIRHVSDLLDVTTSFHIHLQFPARLSLTERSRFGGDSSSSVGCTLVVIFHHIGRPRRARPHPLHAFFRYLAAPHVPHNRCGSPSRQPHNGLHNDEVPRPMIGILKPLASTSHHRQALHFFRDVVGEAAQE